MCSYEDISKEGFELALNLALKKLSSMNLEEICRNSGASRIDRRKNPHPIFEPSLSSGYFHWEDFPKG